MSAWLLTAGNSFQSATGSFCSWPNSSTLPAIAKAEVSMPQAPNIAAFCCFSTDDRTSWAHSRILRLLSVPERFLADTLEHLRCAMPAQCRLLPDCNFARENGCACDVEQGCSHKDPACVSAKLQVTRVPGQGFNRHADKRCSRTGPPWDWQVRAAMGDL